MSSSKNTHVINGWEAFSYFCCSAWNDTYLIDISKAALAGDLHTQKAQFVPVTQIYTSIDNLMSQKKLYSVFEYPMAPDISSATHFYSGNSSYGNLSQEDAASVVLNPIIDDLKFQRIDNSNNVIGQGLKCKPKMSDCIRVGLNPEDSEFSLAVTPTRIPYFGQNQGNMVANTKPQRVIYIVSAEREELEGRQDSHDVSGATTQMKIVNDPFLLTDKNTILINCDIDMELGQGNSALKSIEFGDVTASYSYNWDVHGELNKYPKTSNEYKLPLQQSGSPGSRYLVISCVPTMKTRDKRNNVHKLTEEFYGISPNNADTKNEIISFGYVSYHSLGGKSGVNDDLQRVNSPYGYSFPQSSLVQNKNASVFDNNWFDNWVIAYSDLANALQGKSEGGSSNFSMKMSTNETLAYSKMINQTAIVNTNFLKKLLYIKKNAYLKTEDSVKIYVTVLEDWVTPENALDSYNTSGTANGAAYIPYLDVNASRQIVVPDYDIWDSGESENPTGKSAPTSNYTVEGKSNHNTMVPHQGLDVITAFPSWDQVDILTDNEYEGNKDMLLFDWRAKTLAQPTFACCGLDKIVELGSKSSSVRIDEYAGSFISNEFKYSGGNKSDFILDANSENIYEAQDSTQEGNVNGEEGSRSYVADKNTYVHGMEKVYNQFSLIGNKIVPGKLFQKFDPNKNIFKNDTFQLNKEPITIITSRYTKMPWFTWEGLSLPIGAQSSPASGDIRCILTKKAITAVVSIIRTASLLVSGMVMNHELEFKEQTVIDVITNKTLYIAWYNTRKFLEQLDNIAISEKFIPELTEDYSHGTIRLPSWLDIFKQSSNIKISQFFRSKFCTCDQLERLIGPTLYFDNMGIKGDGDNDKNYPPDFSVTARITAVPKLGVKNIKDETLNYYDISFNSRNQIEYPDANGNEHADDMWRYDQVGQTSPGTTDGTLLRGLLRPIMWDPLGTYPNHALIPFNRRGQILGEDWDKLIYISSEGTLRNNGNCLQKTALNYMSLSSEGKELNKFSKYTAALMYCTPYVPVGKIRIADPQSTTTGYADIELYRHQNIDPNSLNDSANDASKAFLLNYGDKTTDISSSTLFTSTSTVLHCGPPINGTPLRQCTLASGTVIPKGIGYNNGYNNKTVPKIDCYSKKIDLARNRRRLNLHTITKGYNGKGLYTKNNNMAIGPLAWSDLHEKLVETGDGYSHDSLFEKTSANKDFYVTDSLYRTQTMISLLLSGYGLYSDKVYTNDEKDALHPAITGTYDTTQQDVINTPTQDDNVFRNKLYEFSSGRKRFLSGPTNDRTCNNCDLLNLRLNNGDEITQKENPETAYRWVGPSSHFLMEPNTKDIWNYIKEDRPLNSIRSSVKNRNEFSSRSESFASAGTGLDRHTKTYLHNGIKDGTDGINGNSNIFSAIGSAYELGDFYENRPSLFAIARGYDISRNSEIEILNCTSLTSQEINCNYSLSENSEGELIYKKLDKTDLDDKTSSLVVSKKVEIRSFTQAMESMVNSLCKITPATDKAPLHLSDHHFMTLAADEELNSSMTPSSYYNNSKYFRLQADMKDYINAEMTLLDLTGIKDALSERKVGGAMVEAMYYIDDLNSSTIRIFYPTPLRDEFVRPDKSNGMVAVSAYVADTCKGYGLDAAITGITRYNKVHVSDTHYSRAFFWDIFANLESSDIKNIPTIILNVQDSTTDVSNTNINANNRELMIGFIDALLAEYTNDVQDAVKTFMDDNFVTKAPNHHPQFAQLEKRVRDCVNIELEIALIRQELLSKNQFEYEINNMSMTNAEKYLSKNRETFKIINAINKSDSSWNAIPCDKDGIEIDMSYMMDISLFDEQDEDTDNDYFDPTFDISGMIIKYPKRVGLVSSPQVTFNTENAYALKADFSHINVDINTDVFSMSGGDTEISNRTIEQGKLINRNASLLDDSSLKFHPNNTSLPGPYKQLTRTITSANYKAIYNDSFNTIEQHGMTFPTVGDSSFNNIILSNQRSPQGLIQNFIYGRGGIITKKRQSILELVDNLPGWKDGKVPLNDTEGGKLLKAFIMNPYKNATSGATRTGSANGSVGEAQHLRKGRDLAINPNLDLTTSSETSSLTLESKNINKREIDVMRYSNMSVLTITGVRDFAFLNKSFSNMTQDEKYEIFKNQTTIPMEQSTDDSYTKNKIFSRIGSMLLPGTNKKTKYVIANHEQDKETLAKSILKNLGMGNIDDSESANYAIKGTPFEVKVDTDMNSYYLEATNVPGFIASNWNKVQACICAPSMSSKETGNDIKIHPGQLFRANFGVIVKQKTSGVEGSDIGLSAVSQLIPLEYKLTIHTIKSPADVASENSNGLLVNTKMYKENDFHNKVLNNMKINLMLRSVSFDETEIMNYYKLNTIIFLDEGSNGENYKQVDKFITNMPENLTQYLGYMNRTVTAFFQEYPSNGYSDLGRSRYGIDNINKAHTKQTYTPEAQDIDGNDVNVFFHTQYSANQLYFESNLINIKSIQNDFDKQLMAWNEGIVGAKIGDMKLDDFDNISAEQVVDSSETLTEVPGFHILMWTELRNLDDEKNIISKKIITQDQLDKQKGWILSSGKNGLSRGLYDDINFSLYEQDLLVKKGALTIQNEQIINNRNPVVSAIATRGQITPERKYEYGVYKENMWFSMYKNSAASNINIPIINELDNVTHLDSIGLNTSHCEIKVIKKNIGVLVFQHANVLYENHSGINFSIPSSLKNINQALNDDNKLKVNDELVFCMCAVPENNHQVAGKSGVNPSNSSLLNIIINDKNINNTAINQWGLCYEEIKIRSELTKTSEFENQYVYRDENGIRKMYDVDRDIHFNMIIDLFRSKNTTKVRPLMIFNKLPRMEQVKTALDLNCRKPTGPIERLIPWDCCENLQHQLDNSELNAAQLIVDSTASLLQAADALVVSTQAALAALPALPDQAILESSASDQTRFEIIDINNSYVDFNSINGNYNPDIIQKFKTQAQLGSLDVGGNTDGTRGFKSRNTYEGNNLVQPDAWSNLMSHGLNNGDDFRGSSSRVYGQYWIAGWNFDNTNRSVTLPLKHVFEYISSDGTVHISTTYTYQVDGVFYFTYNESDIGVNTNASIAAAVVLKTQSNINISNAIVDAATALTNYNAALSVKETATAKAAASAPPPSIRIRLDTEELNAAQIIFDSKNSLLVAADALVVSTQATLTALSPDPTRFEILDLTQSYVAFDQPFTDRPDILGTFKTRDQLPILDIGGNTDGTRGFKSRNTYQGNNLVQPDSWTNIDGSGLQNGSDYRGGQTFISGQHWITEWNYDNNNRSITLPLKHVFEYISGDGTSHISTVYQYQINGDFYFTYNESDIGVTTAAMFATATALEVQAQVDVTNAIIDASTALTNYNTALVIRDTAATKVATTGAAATAVAPVEPQADYPLGEYAPFLSTGFSYSKNIAIISRLKYHTDHLNNLLTDASGMTGSEGHYYGANTNPTWTPNRTTLGPDNDRETLMDLFYIKNEINANSNMFTVTKLEAEHNVKSNEINGCNAYTGGAYGNHKLTGGNYDLNEVPLYADTSSNQMSIRDGVLKSDICGNILHHYRYLDPKKSGVTGMWVETLIYFTSLLTRPLLNGEDNLSNVFWKVKDTRAGEWTRMPPELKDATNHFEDKMRSYRKCLVSSLLHQHHDSKARFSTEILGRSPPANWLETGKLYNAFPQLEFCATFRNQLVDKSFKDSQGAVKLVKNLAKFPLYCYLDNNNQNIVFPSWKEEGILMNGEKDMIYEEKINYAFALDYYGNEFITEVLDPIIGFGLNSTTPFDRVLEYRNRLIESNEIYIKGSAGQQINSGSKDILDKIFNEGSGSIIRTWDNTPRTLGSDSGFLKELGLIQMWVPFFEILFELKRRLSIKNPIGDQMSSYIQPDVCIGGHVNTFKNKFDIQNYQLKLNTVRLDINLLKECTAFEIKEIEFSDNTLLTLDTINPVGNPQSLFLPIMIKTKEENIETVSPRKVELKTDYLLETLNKMDVVSLMNNIWYRIDEMGNRIVLSPTELARVPLFRNNPGIMFNNNYEPIIKHELTKETTLEEMNLEILKHVDGGEVRGVNSLKNQLKEDRTWSGMGWCLKGIGQRLGFTGGHLDISGREQQNDVTKYLNPSSIKNIDNTYKDWFIEEFGLLANKLNGYDASGSVLFGGSNANSKGASASSVFGAHRQQLHPTQNTGGFVRSAWLAERLATIVFGKQDFPSFDDGTEYSGNIPFNDKMGTGTGGLLTPQHNKKYYQKSKPVMTIIADSEFGRLKLADVRQDDSSRGQLRDYRYPGKRFDYDYNVPIFAESVPNTNGTFACQIIRMIKSGLVSRPEDNKILINEQNVIDQVNGGVYMAFSKDITGVMTSNVHKSIYTHLPNNFTDTTGVVIGERGTGSNTNSTFNNIVMNPQQFMYLKLQEKKIVNVNKPYEGGFVPMQYVLQQLLSNDPQRFILNEKESDRHSDFTQKDSNNFNKTYKSWRTSVLDTGLPTNTKLLNAPDRVIGGENISSIPKPLQILTTFGNETAHPLALCIRGLDLDHCVMTYKDLSNNTLTATASDPEGEFLKGPESDSPNQKGTPDMNDAYLAGHVRDETENIRLEKIFKYGPALHLTEGNAPMRHDNTSLGRHKDLNWNGTRDVSDNDYWGMTENMMTDDVSGSGIVGWNSYIQHTDLTKTYPIYMLPLMDTDTLSIIVTNEGSLKDPLQDFPAAEKNFSEVLSDITREIKGWSDAYTLPKDKLNINNTTGMGNVPGVEYGLDTPDGIMPETIEGAIQDFPSITGHGINISGSTKVPSTSKGLYYDCVNLLIAPELGPYEKLKILEWRSKNFSIDGSKITDPADPNYGKGSVPLTSGADPNFAIEHNAGVLIQKDYDGLNINGQTAAFVYGDNTQSGWGTPENTDSTGNTPCNNSLEAYYAFLGMNNKINPGGASGSVVGSNNTWKSRSNYLAHTLSNEELECYYQKFVTRSFTIKYKLDDSGGNHQDYNNMRISQLTADQVSAFELKDDLSLPKKDINDPDNYLRFEYENYKFFWDISTTTTEREKDQNNVDQMMIAKPILLNSMFTENFMAQGSILIPRRFDGRPMDPNIPSQNIICIRKDNMIIIDKINGVEIKSPSQKDIATKGDGVMRFSLDIGLPMQGGGLIRCKIPLEAAGEDSFAFFLDPEYNRDYLIFKVRDWMGNEKETGGRYEKIKKQNIIQNLHDALQRSQVAQLNERLLEPYTSAIATKYQPPPNTSYQMPILLPSKPGGANIQIDGIVQQKTFFQPLNLILNPIAGGENHFEIKPINDSYYIRTSADNLNWTNYMQQARLSVPRAVVSLKSCLGLNSLGSEFDGTVYDGTPHSQFPNGGELKTSYIWPIVLEPEGGSNNSSRRFYYTGSYMYPSPNNNTHPGNLERPHKNGITMKAGSVIHKPLSSEDGLTGTDTRPYGAFAYTDEPGYTYSNATTTWVLAYDLQNAWTFDRSNDTLPSLASAGNLVTQTINGIVVSGTLTNDYGSGNLGDVVVNCATGVIFTDMNDLVITLDDDTTYTCVAGNSGGPIVHSGRTETIYVKTSKNYNYFRYYAPFMLTDDTHSTMVWGAQYLDFGSETSQYATALSLLLNPNAVVTWSTYYATYNYYPYYFRQYYSFPGYKHHKGDRVSLYSGHWMPSLRAGDLVKQEFTGAIGQVTKDSNVIIPYFFKQAPVDTFNIYATSEYYSSNNTSVNIMSEKFYIELYDSYGDGWHYAPGESTFIIYADDIEVLSIGAPGPSWSIWKSETFSIPEGKIITTSFTSQTNYYPYECSWKLFSEIRGELFISPMNTTYPSFNITNADDVIAVAGQSISFDQALFTNGRPGQWTKGDYMNIEVNFDYWPQKALNEQIQNGDKVFYINGGLNIHYANIFYKYPNNSEQPDWVKHQLIYLELLPGIENSAWGRLLFGGENNEMAMEHNSFVEITLREGVSQDINGDDLATHFTQKTHLMKIRNMGPYQPSSESATRTIDVRQMNDISFNDQIDLEFYKADSDSRNLNSTSSDYTFLIQNVPIIAGNTRGFNFPTTVDPDTNLQAVVDFVCPPCMTNDVEVFFETDGAKRALDICGRYFNINSTDIVCKNYGHSEQLTNISSYHPQFGTMNGGNSTMDLSAVIHDVRQSQLTGYRHDGKNNLWNTHPQRATIYSLDLLALLNTTYDGDKWTHRLAPNPTKRVKLSHVTSSPITTYVKNMLIAEGNTRDKMQTPILVISDIGKGWVDYEGLMMSRDRYFRLCEVLGDPPDHYAIAMDDLGNNQSYSDLDIPGENKGFYGKYFLEGAAPWDLSANPHLSSPDGSARGGNFLDIPNQVQLLNNPIQHLHYGGYTTFDDPTTGAGCVGFPNADRLKDISTSGGNHRKQFRLAFKTTGERTLPLLEDGKLTNDSTPGSYLFFPHWSNSNPVGQQDAYHSVATDFNNTGTVPLDTMRMVHPSKYVFDPKLAGNIHPSLMEFELNIIEDWSFMDDVIDPAKYGIWTGGAKDRNIDGNHTTYVSNSDSEPFTMEYVALRYTPIIHGNYHSNDWRSWSTSYLSKSRSDKDNKFLDISPSLKHYKEDSFPKTDAETYLLNDASLVWGDIYGLSNSQMNDGYVDNSRYRWSGSTYYTHNGKIKSLNFSKTTAAANRIVPSLKNDRVGKEVSFKLHTSEKIGQSNWLTKTTDVPYRAWMTQENQQRYYDTIKFFSTRADITGDTTLNKKPERDEKRQARSETEEFLSDETNIESLI
tara:strand:+ start:912 stop:20987 length:20076 start_codon:yes stop_codon:yes gene_type:complete